MPQRLPALAFGALAGLLMAVQGTLNTQLSRTIGRVEATLVIQTIGLLSAGFLLFPLRLGTGDLGQLRQAPWYTLLGGVLGVAIVFTVVAAMTRLGIATATTAILVAQILTAAAIDHFGLFGAECRPFAWFKLLGVALLAAGARLLLS
ncbi:MAG: DMT family transporter [Bacillota bacterium]|nr:DMT family transporter [Bacillota bacterium]